MGIPLVRGLGPRLSCASSDPGGRRLRQKSTRFDAQPKLPAPQWPNSGLRMELRRRESARASLGHHFYLSVGENQYRERRCRLAGAKLSETAAELYLVAEPQGSFREERF